MCPINRCGRDVGAGTNTQIEYPDGARYVFQVCEAHWQALKTILPLPVPLAKHRR